VNSHPGFENIATTSKPSGTAIEKCPLPSVVVLPVQPPVMFTATLAVTYACDTLPIGKGRLTSVADSVSTTTYRDYDDLGRTHSSTQTTDGTLYAFGHLFDLAGNLTSESYRNRRKERI
jgi:hypothetical protein